MPSSDGSYTYIFGLDLEYLFFFFIRDDIVHCGGAPKDCYCKGIKYPCHHVYFLTSIVDYPNNNIVMIALMECNLINITIISGDGRVTNIIETILYYNTRSNKTN